MNDYLLPSELLKAFVCAKAEFKTIQKNGRNNHLKYDYALLSDVYNAVLPALTKYGMTLNGTMNAGLYTVYLAHAESGQYMSSSFELPTFVDMQRLGSAITYISRYLAVTLLGITADLDDDAVLACEPGAMVKKEKQAFAAPSVKSIENAFVKTDVPIDLSPKQVEEIKTRLKGLWEMKKEIAIKTDPVRAETIGKCIIANFQEKNALGEMEEIQAVTLKKRYEWLSKL